jgi:ribosomal protein S12 methylthiotransferase accessory factor
LEVPLGTSLRARPAAETIARARRLAPGLGLCHVEDITALDHLGLPVVVSVRSGGSALHVHAGKGLTPSDALAGALMEAVEYAAAEYANVLPADLLGSWSQIVSRWPQGLAPSDFAPRLGGRVCWRARTPALLCEQLGTRQRVPLPTQLVLLPARQPAEALFGSSSNGLASGNTLQEATLHALLEVLERDAVALHIGRDGSRPVALATLPAPFAGLAGAWHRRGVQLRVRWLPSALGLPCFEAVLLEPGVDQPGLRLARGWGLHFDRNRALARAICEAAQSRLAVILAAHRGRPGAAEMALRLQGGMGQRRPLAAAAGNGCPVPFEAVDHEASPPLGAALGQLLARLPAAGLGPVFRRRLPVPPGGTVPRGMHVVKVVVARAETPVGAHPRVGPRLLQRLLGAA